MAFGKLSESQRLKTLRQLKILSSPLNGAIEDLIRLAAHVCAAPIALLSLADAKHHRIKCQIGVDLPDLPRDTPLFESVLLRRQLLLVPDAKQDPSFATDRLVTSAPQIRFFASAPLVTPDAQIIGALSVIDREPKQLTDIQTEALRILSSQVIASFGIQRHVRDFERKLAEQENLTDTFEQENKILHEIIENIRDGMFYKDGEARYRWINQVALAILTKEREHVLTRTNEQIFPIGSELAERLNGYDREVMRNPGLKVFDYVRPSVGGAKRTYQPSVLPRLDQRGNCVGLIGVFHDVTELELLQDSVRRERAESEARWFERTAELETTNAALHKQVAERRRAEQAIRAQEKIFQFIAEGVDDLIAVLNADGIREYNNPAYSALFGDPEALRGTEPFSQIHPEDRDRVLKLFRETVQTGKGGQAEFRFVLEDQSIRYIESKGIPISASSGEVEKVIVVSRDVTKRREAEEHLKLLNEELEQRGAQVKALTEMALRLHGCSKIEAVKEEFSRYSHQILPGSAGAVYLFNPAMDEFEQILLLGNPAVPKRYFSRDQCCALRGGAHTHVVHDINVDPICEHATGVQHPYMCVPTEIPPETSVVLHLQLLWSELRDPGALERSADWRLHLASAVSRHFALEMDKVRRLEKLLAASRFDTLTGLYSRGHMDKELPREVLRSARSHSMLGIIMVDIDHFKRFNDDFGHTAGDFVLREVGDVIRSNLRETDIPCRYGGEEFLLILPEVASEQAILERAKKIHQGVKGRTLLYERQKLKITLSIGLAFLPYEQGQSEEYRRAGNAAFNLATKRAKQLIEAADVVLRRAKESGRDRIEVARSADYDQARNPTQVQDR